MKKDMENRRRKRDRKNKGRDRAGEGKGMRETKGRVWKKKSRRG